MKLNLIVPVIIFSISAYLYAANDLGRTILTVEFDAINAKGYPMLKITNTKDKDIDLIIGGFKIEDKQGQILFATGHSDMAKGLVFMKAKQTTLMSPYGLKTKPEVMKILKTNPQSLNFYFEVQEIVYTDGSSEAGFGPVRLKKVM